MEAIKKGKYSDVYTRYKSERYFFPLIAAVLREDQDGEVYVDDSSLPSQVFVEHCFGFSQIFGTTNSRFEAEIENYLFVEKKFKPEKERLYSPQIPLFMERHTDVAQVSIRQRFFLNQEKYFNAIKESQQYNSTHIEIRESAQADIEIIDKKFNVVSRFWRNSADFFEKANAMIVIYRGEFAAICYAAAVGNNCAEIDVATLPEFRRKNLAKFAVLAFIEKCQGNSLEPLWDCFTNNLGSMELAKSTGFVPALSPYHFFTINK